MPLGNSFTILKSKKYKEAIVEEFATNISAQDILFHNNELYVLTENKYIKKIDLYKNITHFADLKLSNEYSSCSRIAVDSSGNIYSIDNVSIATYAQYRYKLLKADTSGNVTDLFTSGPNGMAIQIYNDLLFYSIIGSAINKHNLTNNQTSFNVGNINTLTSRNIKFDSKGNLYSCAIDGGNVIRKFTKNDGAAPAFLGYDSPIILLDFSSILVANTPNSGPQGMCFDKNDNLYFNIRNAIYKRSQNGTISLVSGLIFSAKEDKIGSLIQARFDTITSMCWVDEGLNGVIYISDFGNNKIKKLFL